MVTAITGCAATGDLADRPNKDAQLTPVSCADRLVGPNSRTDGELDSSHIHIVNWNIRKGSDPKWSHDLSNHHALPDLYVFQEAPLLSDVWNETTAEQHHAFAPGFRTRRSQTGVMTISTTTPLTQCNLMASEPWFRTPKATVITEYGLSGTDETLLVVNVHAINFTFGLRAFTDQINQAMTVMKEHDGPIFLSGDFNTWRGRRTEVLREMTSGLDLQMLSFADDHRKRFLGSPLDHIFTRGLEVLDATTTAVESSDHNPMSVSLRL
jgi:endonuclease/exonuclease/phosphatase (EEP) superfamily protein YafD